MSPLNVAAKSLLNDLKQRGIQAQETSRRNVPPEALMYDRGAPIPAVVVSPQSEWGVAQTLKLIKHYRLYHQLPVLVKSGGHGYFNGASCSGVMVNLTGMTG
jgi:FAD/FMN-containing dehydrogenase